MSTKRLKREKAKHRKGLIGSLTLNNKDHKPKASASSLLNDVRELAKRLRMPEL